MATMSCDQKMLTWIWLERVVLAPEYSDRGLEHSGYCHHWAPIKLGLVIQARVAKYIHWYNRHTSLQCYLNKALV